MATIVHRQRWSCAQSRCAMIPLGIPKFTFMATLGSLIERGVDHAKVWEEFGVAIPDRWPVHTVEDFYDDAVGFLSTVTSLGLIVGIAGNQPADVVSILREQEVPADFVASSGQWGVAKPSTEFFPRVVRECGCEPSEIMYVGDRVDNEIVPATGAGLLTCHIRRGPWGMIQSRWPGAKRAARRVDTLTELGGILTDQQC